MKPAIDHVAIPLVAFCCLLYPVDRQWQTKRTSLHTNRLENQFFRQCSEGFAGDVFQQKLKHREASS